VPTVTKLKAALIGTGAIAREHLAALSDMPNVEIGAVCDLSSVIAEMTAERFGLPAWYTDYERMLDEVRPDLVHITTPPGSHYALARSCLERGFNVLCEKPITVEYQEFAELKRIAAASRRLLVENQNFRCHSSVRRILELAAAGELGDVVDVQVNVFLDIAAPGSRFVDRNLAHPCLAMRGGAIADFLTHLAYLAHLFTGTPLAIRSVWAKRVADSVLPADEFRAQVKGERATASLAFSANAQPSGFWVRVIGTRMQAEANLWEPPRLVLRRARGGATPFTPLLNGIAESRAVLDASIRGFARKLGGTSRYDGLPLFISRTYAALDGGDEAPVSLDDIDAVSRMVAAFTNPEFTV
jgi:predicted dehydrogenase